MSHVPSWLACLGMVLYQFHATQSIQLMLASKFLPEEMYLAAVGYCFGIMAGWCTVSVVTRRDATAIMAGPSSGATARFAVLAVVALAVSGMRWYLLDEWQWPVARGVLQAGSGFLLMVTHWLFFSLVDTRSRASLYCGSLAAGFALAEIHYRIVYTGPGVAGADVHLHRTLIFTTFVYALVLCGGIWMTMRSIAAGEETRAEGAGSVRTAGSLVLLLVVLFLLHGMVNGAFLPFYTVSRVQDNRVAATALTVVVLGLGARLFRHGVSRSFRPVVTVCGILHMAMAVFSIFSTDLFLVRSLHALIGPAQYLFIAMAVCVLAATAPSRWQVVAVTIPFALKALEILFIPYLLGSAGGKGEALPLAAILVAVVFYAFGRRIAPGPIAVTEERPRDSISPDAVAVDDDATVARRKVIRELGDRYGFSARERQVGELLASGMAADHIGGTLGLSTNTVNTYVRRIVLKTGCDGRRGFVALVRGGLDE
ncbi:MAG: helix-turn-helix transcriptional regulator [Planctomycetes bacterium]|nr:helix-turn-helix transcriptional regulator [Planctomycetota bacterium]